MTTPLLPASVRAPILRAIGLLNVAPYWLVALIARAATCTVFLSSFLVKIADWNATLMLFENEYHVPIIPPHPAAYLTATLELTCSVLVMAGLATRFCVLILLGMTTVIEVFIYPMAWPTHIQWLAFMLVLLVRGPGAVSLDALIGPRLVGASASRA